MKRRLLTFTLFASFLMGSVVFALQPLIAKEDIGYLKEMPSPEKVVSDIKRSGKDKSEVGKCVVLSEFIYIVGVQSEWRDNYFDEEKKVIKSYWDACKVKRNYKNNQALRDDLVEKYFSANWRKKYYRLDKKRSQANEVAETKNVTNQPEKQDCQSTGRFEGDIIIIDSKDSGLTFRLEYKRHHDNLKVKFGSGWDEYTKKGDRWTSSGGTCISMENAVFSKGSSKWGSDEGATFRYHDAVKRCKSKDMRLPTVKEIRSASKIAAMNWLGTCDDPSDCRDMAYFWTSDKAPRGSMLGDRSAVWLISQINGSLRFEVRDFHSTASEARVRCIK